MQKHYVNFLSPGTFFCESSSKEIDSWDIDKAQEMARSISERYGATPFAFYFTTRSRSENDLDSKESARSVKYHLGGTIETLEEIEERNDPSESILISNMRCNGWNKVIINTNSWRSTQPFVDGKDVLLDWKK